MTEWIKDQTALSVQSYLDLYRPQRPLIFFYRAGKVLKKPVAGSRRTRNANKRVIKQMEIAVVGDLVDFIVKFF